MRKQTLRCRLILFSFSCTLILCGGHSHAQKIIKSQPSVYLTFQGFVKKTANDAYPSEGARLVLHNNTRWPIYYSEWLERTPTGDVAMIYNIVSEEGCPEQRSHVDVITKGKLRSGGSVSFTVPREDFPKNSKIYVGFNFSWEIVKDAKLPNETRHLVYFYSSALPEWP
ncbi:MAG: hypothetical protein QOE33_506 [Acidobacteriota bacterium]|nr:hypothetical protein [Acidobacteriota bacterium]